MATKSKAERLRTLDRIRVAKRDTAKPRVRGERKFSVATAPEEAPDADERAGEIAPIVTTSFLEAFEKLGGVTGLVRFGRKNPSAFYRMLAAMAPALGRHAKGHGLVVQVASFGEKPAPKKEVATIVHAAADLQHLPPSPFDARGLRVAVCGPPKTGKTTFASELGVPVQHTDDVLDRGWSGASDEVSRWFDAETFCVEGVAVLRALRKWRERHPGAPPPLDRLVMLWYPRVPYTKPGQARMSEGVAKDFAELEHWLSPALE